MHSDSLTHSLCVVDDPVLLLLLLRPVALLVLAVLFPVTVPFTLLPVPLLLLPELLPVPVAVIAGTQKVGCDM